jgi:hypothetical protein
MNSSAVMLKARGDAQSGTGASWVNAFVYAGAGFFIFALFVAAVFDPTIRLLHALQAVIYVAVIVLARRENAWGFGAGCFMALFWNYTNLFVTTFIRAGWQQLTILMRTGRLARPDLLIALAAAAGHFLLIGACLAGFLRTRPDSKRWGQFAGGGVLAIAYFVLIIVTTGPQYVGLLKRVFHV